MKTTAVLCLGVACVLATPLHATTHVIAPDGTGDHATVQDGVHAAQWGDTVLVLDGVFTGAGNRDIQVYKPLVIRSQNGPDHTTIDCEQLGRGFSFIDVPDGSLALEGITIMDGQANGGAGVQLLYAAATIRDCVFISGSAHEGGAIHNSLPATTIPTQVVGCRFIDNHADNDYGAPGGAIVSDAPIVIEDCEFRDNRAHDGVESTSCGFGGAIFASAALTVRGSLFVGNAAGCMGGDAIAYLGDAGQPLVLENNTIVEHLEDAACGVVVIETLGSVDIRGNLFWGNASPPLRCEWTDCWPTDPAPAASRSTGEISCNLFDWPVGACADYTLVNNLTGLDPLFCDAAAGDYTLHADSPVAPDATECGQIGAFGVGCGVIGVPGSTSTSTGLTLRITPNPSRRSVRFAWSAPIEDDAVLEIYDATGRRVHTLALEGHRTSVYWSGLDMRGEPVAAGTYFGRLRSHSGAAAQRVLIID